MPNTVLKCGKATRFSAHSLSQIPVKIHYTTRHFIPKKYLNLVFCDSRNLKISKSKKSERYFRDKIEIFIRLFDEHCARHFESHWRETWRHTGRWTVPQISMETPSPPLESWLNNLEQTPLNRSQQIPALIKRLIDRWTQVKLTTTDDWKTNNLTKN